MSKASAALLLAPALLFSSPATAGDGPPKAEVRRVTDTYWGVEVVDDYQYLEQVNDPAVMRWVEAQDAYTRSWLGDFPQRDEITERVRSLTREESPDHYYPEYRGGRLFAVKKQPPKQQPFIVLLESLDDTTAYRVLVDPNTIDPSASTSIDFYEPSHDGRLLAVSLSRHGTEDGTLFVYEVASGRRLPDEIPRVNGGTAGGSVAWNADDSGFFYTRYPYPGERPEEDLSFYQQIWYHRLGDEISEDVYALGETFPRIAEIDMTTSADGRHTLAVVSNGDGGEYEFWLHGPSRPWTKIASFGDEAQKARFGADGAIYLLSRKDAPMRKILRVTVDNPSIDGAETVVSEGNANIETFVAARSRIYVGEMLGGPSWLHSYDLDGHDLGVVGMGRISTVSYLVEAGGDRLLYRAQSFTTPPAWYEYTPEMESPRATALATTSPADYSDCHVERIFATADDGTKIPINVISLLDTPKDGSAPLLLYGYGSYGISMTPSFNAGRRIWIEQGGIYAVANIRGGGEFGDTWHRAANLEHKKVSMDDFAACARHLVEEGYTSADRLAIQGGSAGGLLVYGTMSHYPHRMAAVVCHVGIGDALRTELSPNGEFNITEFGTVRNETQFHGMLAASPFHNVRDDVSYPAVLSLTGMNDPRVEPWQSFKMTARLQATAGANPVLMRVSMETGHGRGTALSEYEAQLVDVYCFLFKQLGLRYTPPHRTSRAD